MIRNRPIAGERIIGAAPGLAAGRQPRPRDRRAFRRQRLPRRHRRRGDPARRPDHRRRRRLRGADRTPALPGRGQPRGGARRAAALRRHPVRPARGRGARSGSQRGAGPVGDARRGSSSSDLPRARILPCTFRPFFDAFLGFFLAFFDPLLSFFFRLFEALASFGPLLLRPFLLLRRLFEALLRLLRSPSKRCSTDLVSSLLPPQPLQATPARPIARHAATTALLRRALLRFKSPSDTSTPSIGKLNWMARSSHPCPSVVPAGEPA